MRQLTFSELFHQMYQLYQNEQYAQAFDLVTREAVHFPEQIQKIYFWRVCLACRMDETKLALDLLNEAVEAGHWYAERSLRGDADLEPLQGLPEFEQLVKICLEQYTIAQTQATPRLITRQPKNSPPLPWPLLLALHGNNSNAEMTADGWDSVTSMGWHLALPQSSQVFEPNTYTWEDRALAKREIQNHYTALREQYPLAPEQVVIGGFSLGGGLAIELVLSKAIEARGFIAVGPYIPDIDHLVSLVESGQANEMRGYIIVGEQDEICYKDSQILAARLRANDFPCELEIHSHLGHEYPSEFDKALTRALESW
jgi:predicted esterase